ncbi:MAG: hypothetical protein ACRCUY_01305 [Thermoguttaceae bacterium]
MNTSGVQGQEIRRINPPTYVGGSLRRRLAEHARLTKQPPKNNFALLELHEKK